MKDDKKMKFHPLVFALSLGTLWGVATLLLCWFSITGWGARYVDTTATFYIGMGHSFIGGIIGGLWGFFWGFIGGFFFAWLYNSFHCKFCKN